jgi:hypothetical protein
MIWIFLFAVAFVLLAAALWAVRGSLVDFKSLSQLESRIQPVDLAAFRNLIDPAETQFLRRHLPAAVFRKVQRQRALAALEYVARAASNAAVLLRIGEANRKNPQTEIASAAATLVSEALRTRLLAVPVRLYLCLDFIVPGRSLTTSSLLEQYERLTYRLGRLAALQSPADASRLLASL